MKRSKFTDSQIIDSVKKIESDVLNIVGKSSGGLQTNLILKLVSYYGRQHFSSLHKNRPVSMQHLRHCGVGCGALKLQTVNSAYTN